MSDIFPEQPITSLPAAVAFMGALPMPVGPQQPPFPLAPRTCEEKLGQDVARLQGLLAEAVRDAHRARSERDLIRERVSEPFGCKHCGVEKRSHGRRYIGGQGMHAWERPSDEQVKARMLARRVARSPLPATPELEQLHDELTGVSLSLYEEELLTERLRWALASARRGRSRLRAQVAAFDALELGAVDGRMSAVCEVPGHPTWLRKPDDRRGCPWCQVAALLEERHSTNEALSKADEALRVQRDRIAELEHTVQGMVEGLNGHDCPPPGESPMQAVTRFAVRLMEAERLLAEDGCSCPPADHPHQVGCLLDLPAPGSSERPVNELTTVYMPVAAYREDPHDSPLHHDYRVGHDLPELGGAS